MSCLEQIDLGERLIQGDEDVLEEILRQHGPTIMAVLKRKYWSVYLQADIEDLLSIALFRLWQSRERFDSDKGSLRVWLFRIADNAARDVLKHGWHKSRRLEVFPDQGALNQLSANPPPPSETCPKNDSREAQVVREILAELPESQRRILIADAHSRDGVASSEFLAEELGVSPSTVRVYRKRGLARLREEVQRRFGTVSQPTP